MALTKSDTKKLQPSDSAPEFALKNIDEEVVSSKDYLGTPLVIIFMCNHCPYVIPKMDEIAKIQNDYEGKAIIIGINSNNPEEYEEDSFENMKVIAQEKGYKHYLVDETQEIAKAYGATCTPDPFVFDKNHKLVYHGRINDQMEPNDQVTKNDLREVLDKVLAGENVENWFEPSIGCSIKWRI
jgi:peroxiredoxin